MSQQVSRKFRASGHNSNTAGPYAGAPPLLGGVPRGSRFQCSARLPITGASSPASRPVISTEEVSRLLGESVKSLVALHAPDGTYLWVSPSSRELLGYEPEELVGTPSYALFHPEDRGAIRTQSHAPALGGAPTLARPYRIRCKDGAYVWFETRTQPILDDDGNVTRLRTTSHDVTAEQRAAAELHASKELLDSVLASSLDGVMAFDAIRAPNGTIIDFLFRLVNPAAEAIVGRSARELIGRRLLEEMPGNGEEGLFDAYCRVVETGEPFGSEFFYDHDGIRAWLQNTAVKRGDGFAVTFRDVTVNKYALDALQESEDRFRTAFEDAAIGKALVSPDGRFVRVNPALCDLVGYSATDLLRLTFQEITHPEDLEKDLTYVRQMLDGEISTYEVEKRYLHRDGHTVWALLSVSRLVDEGGLRYFIAEIQDITERKRSEEDLRTSEERLRLLLQITARQSDDVDDQISASLTLARDLLDLDIAILSRVEDETYTVAHVSAPEASPSAGQTFPLGQTYCSITLESDGVVALDHMGTSEHRGHPCYSAFGLEAYIGMPIRVNGRLYGTLNFSSPRPRPRPFTDLDRHFVLLLGHWIGHAIERQRNEAALRRSEENLAYAQRIAHLGSWEQDLRTGAQLWSEELYRLYDLDRSDPPADLATALVEGVHPDDRARVQRELAAVLNTPAGAAVHDARRDFEYRIPHRDGGLRHVRCLSRVVRDERGGAVSVIGTVQDVTETKEAERLKNEFISVVSHELRTPLTSIAGSLQLVASQAAGAVSGPVRDMVGIAVRNSDRLVRLINDILDVQKVEAGGLKLRLEPHDLEALLSAAVEGNAGYGERRNVRIALRQPLPPASLDVDEDRFMQVMANLLSNAIKFSPENGEVEVAARATERGVRISVTDHGPGIPASFRDLVFSRFAQADGSSTRTHEGTGLGLNITRSLVELHKGAISFETEVGAGTTFHVDLPARLLSADPAGPEEACLLIVEDDEATAELMDTFLQEAGFRVDKAHSAAEARRYLGASHYDVLTLDLGLPDADGLSLLREIKEHDPALPVIVASVAADSRRKALQGVAIPLVDWLNKPFSADRLVASVRRALRSTPRARILHLEDDADCAAVTAGLLSELGDVVTTSTLAHARALLDAEPFDLVLLDLGLPDGDGLDLLDPVDGLRLPPVVIYSARETDAAALQVCDALVKGRMTDAEFVRVVRNAIGPCAAPAPLVLS